MSEKTGLKGATNTLSAGNETTNDVCRAPTRDGGVCFLAPKHAGEHVTLREYSAMAKSRIDLDLGDEE